jgi:hypothetical protein
LWVFLINSDLHNFRRNRSLNGAILRLLQIPHLIASWRRMSILRSRHDVRRMFRWKLVRLFKLSSSFLWNIVQFRFIPKSVISCHVSRLSLELWLWLLLSLKFLRLDKVPFIFRTIISDLLLILLSKRAIFWIYLGAHILIKILFNWNLWILLRLI